MMKQTLHALGALTIAAALTMLSTACTNDDSLLADEPQASAVKTYTVSIPATMAGDETRAVSIDGTTIDRRFNANERVYVYNVKKDGLMDGYLQPTDISTDGKSCTLTGELTSYGIVAGDSLKLMYNLSHSTDAYFNYLGQNGSKESLLDGAVATVRASSYTGGVLTTTANASFLPVQSMFRFKFVDENNNAITVKTLKVESTGGDIAATYWPLENGYGNSCIIVTPSSPTSDYLYASIRIREDQTPTEMKFTVKDDNDKEYVGTRTAPTGGFKNGKYYYNTEPIQLTKLDTRVAPDVTWTSVKNGAAVSPDAYNCYSVLGPLKAGSDLECNPAEITISGTSNGYWFYMGLGGTVHLNDLTAAYDESQFIYSNGDLNLDINGTNSITSPGASQCIFVSGGTLKLSGNGTLTVTATSSGRCGLYSHNYKNDTNSDPAVLAADGYTVTRSNRQNNSDGTYTWTYTVAPVKPTITWTNPSTPVEPDNYQSYYITVDNVDIALSGTSNGYSVMAAYSGTMHLNGLNATFSDETDEYADFIYANGNLNLVINGNNTINCKGQERCVSAGGTLKLSGNGTLTVISDENQLCGIWGTNYQRSNNNYSSTGELNVTDKLAADGYTVMRSARQSNGDGTYTWTYTVAPVNP